MLDFHMPPLEKKFSWLRAEGWIEQLYTVHAKKTVSADLQSHLGSPCSKVFEKLYHRLPQKEYLINL